MLKLFIILCIMLVISGIRYNPDCNSKAKLDLSDPEYAKHGWPWSKLHIGAWVSDEFESTVLEIAIRYKGISLPIANEKIMIGRNKTLMISERNSLEYDATHTHPTLKSGWAAFMFNITTHVMGIYNQKDQQELFIHLLHEQSDIESIVIKGSNLTIDCNQDLPLWWIRDLEVSVPLIFTDNFHNFTLHSTKPFTPAFKFDEDDPNIIFGLSNETNSISVLNADSKMSAHTQHNFSLICGRKPDYEGITCEFLNTLSTVVATVHLKNEPSRLIVLKSKEDTEDYIVTMKKHTQTIDSDATTTSNDNQTDTPDFMLTTSDDLDQTTESTTHLIHVIIGVSVPMGVIILALVIAIAVIISKNKKPEDKDPEEPNHNEGLLSKDKTMNTQQENDKNESCLEEKKDDEKETSLSEKNMQDQNKDSEDIELGNANENRRKNGTVKKKTSLNKKISAIKKFSMTSWH